MCIYNQMIKNRKYVKNKKNEGHVPSLPDRRIEYVPAKCGKCIECRKQYGRDWMVRLLEEIKTNKNGKFITLTFTDKAIAEIGERTIKKTEKKTGKIIKSKISELQGYERDNKTAIEAIRIFTERWREKFGKAPRHWLVTELGHNGTENIHLHGIIWTDETYETIHKLWQFGYIWPRPESKTPTYVNTATIKYIVKYVSKQDLKHKEYRGKVLASHGIGKGFLNSLNAREIIAKANSGYPEYLQTYTTTTGHKIALPTYYKKKLFTEEQIETMWLKKLDEEVRYVLGRKIDVSKSQAEYEKAVIEAKRHNKEMGYGGRINQNRKEYEEQRREIMYITRIKKGTKKQN